jgi:cob(I)alamin adenosyltransferase
VIGSSQYAHAQSQAGSIASSLSTRSTGQQLLEQAKQRLDTVRAELAMVRASVKLLEAELALLEKMVLAVEPTREPG